MIPSRGRKLACGEPICTSVATPPTSPSTFFHLSGHSWSPFYYRHLFLRFSRKNQSSLKAGSPLILRDRRVECNSWRMKTVCGSIGTQNLENENLLKLRRETRIAVLFSILSISNNIAVIFTMRRRGYHDKSEVASARRICNQI